MNDIFCLLTTSKWLYSGQQPSVYTSISCNHEHKATKKLCWNRKIVKTFFFVTSHFFIIQCDIKWETFAWWLEKNSRKTFYSDIDSKYATDYTDHLTNNESSLRDYVSFVGSLLIIKKAIVYTRVMNKRNCSAELEYQDQHVFIFWYLWISKLLYIYSYIWKVQQCFSYVSWIVDTHMIAELIRMNRLYPHFFHIVYARPCRVGLGEDIHHVYKYLLPSQ